VTRPVRPRAVAQQDIEAAIGHYAAEAGAAVALAFIDAVQAGFRRIGAHPGLGSPRIGFELRLDRLCAWPVRRFPYLVLYRVEPDHIDVWRVLHAKRDIPGWMSASIAP
jgi:toxin ParE1/3/4